MSSSKPHPGGYVRDRHCLNCHHEWTSPVMLATATANLTGEETCFCPKCFSRATVSDPAYRPDDEEDAVSKSVSDPRFDAAFDSIFGTGEKK